MTQDRKRSSISKQLGINHETLRQWVRRAETGRDRRVLMLEVTAGGKAALDRVTRSAERHLADTLVGLDSPSARRLQAGLGVLREVFAAPPAAQAERRRNGRSAPKRL